LLIEYIEVVSLLCDAADLLSRCNPCITESQTNQIDRGRSALL
jgi:hypothetical protein